MSMSEDELKEWKIEKKAEAYEVFQKDPTSAWEQGVFQEKLKAIDKIQP